MSQRRSCLPWFILSLILLAVGLVASVAYAPTLAGRSFGSPSPRLSSWQRFSYAIDLLWNVGDLTVPRDPNGAERVFTIEAGESATSISSRLEQNGLIRRARTFRAYLIWTGLDSTIQTGTYRLSPASTAMEIARTIQSTFLVEVKFYVLPGWRMEEIAAALPTSGLSVSPQAFLAEAARPANPPAYLPRNATAEGFFLPDEYILPRSISTTQFVSAMLRNFTDHLTPELQAGFTRQGLTVDQAVTLASIIERETMVEDEMPSIASVFFNRLAAGMKLDSDPTVQYALGYNPSQGTWWTNPLNLEDLRIDSPYNTYIHPGLPPGPISNPGLKALEAVANPTRTGYYYFRARCDGSGRHTFAETFQQHLQNACP